MQRIVFTIILVLLALVTTPSMGHGKRLHHRRALQWLTQNGIPVKSKGKCSNRYNRWCVSLEQILENTIRRVIELKQVSGCHIIVTGGTEVGHNNETPFSHWNGYRVNIIPHGCINRYIATRMTYIRRGDDNMSLYRDFRGNIYAEKREHWDIQFGF